MSGVNYRGRARLRDRQATERLSALLDGVSERSESQVEDSSADPAETGESVGPLHRQSVAVRSRFSRPALVVLVAVLLVICGTTGLSLLAGDRGSEAEVVATAESSTARSAPSEEPSDGGASAPSHEPTGTLTVHVVGEVRRPAVVEVPPGARVIDAVEAAGGLTDDAVTERINLAHPVTDGQQVLIPNQDTAADPMTGQSGTSAGDSADPPSRASGPGGAVNDPAGKSSGTAPGGLINLNTAEASELEELPRVGPVLAQRILDFRTEHGPFTAAEQLDDVSGIGPAMLEALLPLVTV